MSTSQNNRPSFVLFVMSGCKFSASFLKEVKLIDDLSKKIKVVDINSVPDIPPEVTEVPCIYDGKRVYEGKECFKWLKDISIMYLSAANDGDQYSFVNGDAEKVFNTFSFINQENGSSGMGGKTDDPTRSISMSDQPKKASLTMDDLISQRAADFNS